MSGEQQRVPDFFIVGAPKSGTTSLYDMLTLHPQVFMMPKELHFFGKDLDIKKRTTAEQYFSLISQVPQSKLLGDASVWYLYSSSAPLEIKNCNPQAKIIILLRHPVDMLYSLHSQNLIDCNEDVSDFETALGLESRRKKGNHIPAAANFSRALLYSEAGRYTEHVKRYMDVFGEKNVLLLWFDDLLENPGAWWVKTLDFLSVDTCQPPVIQASNSNKRLRFRLIQRWMKQPPPLLKKIWRTALPFQHLRKSLMNTIHNKNVYPVSRKPLPQQLKKQLSSMFISDIKELEILTGKDLSGWKDC